MSDQIPPIVSGTRALPVGTVSGWSAWPLAATRWAWSAYGPRGSQAGTAETRDAARTQAAMHAARLTEPRS